MASYSSVESKISKWFHLSQESVGLLTANGIGALGILPYLFTKHFLDRQGIQPFGNKTIAGIAGLNEYGTIIPLALAPILYGVSVYDIEKHGGVSSLDMGLSIAGTVSLVAGLFNLAFDPPVDLTPMGKSIVATFKKSTSVTGKSSADVIKSPVDGQTLNGISI